MSNPGVKILAKSSGKKRFVIEDNIGESIHIHIDNLRMDFTIDQFLTFSKLIKKSLVELNVLEGYDINQFDLLFLKEISSYLDNLIEIKVEKICLKDILCVIHTEFKGLKFDRLVQLQKTPAYKYLQNHGGSFLKYKQLNYLNLSNEERLNSLIKSIKNNGYPFNNEYIILFNSQNIIRDGQHRAAVLAHLYGLDHEILIQRFIFKGKKHKFKYRRSNLKNLIMWVLKKIKNKLIYYLN